MVLCTNIYAINVAVKLTTMLVHQHYPVSVTGCFFTILQHSWWAQIMWLDY